MDSQTSPKKKPIVKRWWFWGIAIIVLIVIISSTGSSSSKKSIPAPSDNGTTASAPAQTETASATQALLDLSGSGSKTTAKFTAAGDWDLNWSYDCSNFAAGQGNFQVFVYNGDGTISFNNAPINQLGTKDSGVEHYHKGGTYYLTMNSECKWKVQANG